MTFILRKEGMQTCERPSIYFAFFPIYPKQRNFLISRKTRSAKRFYDILPRV